MSKFNTTNTNRTLNKSGHIAYSMDDKTKLMTQVLTSFFNERKFYGDNSEEIKQTIRRVISKDAGFVSNLAVFARREFNMRSVSHVLAAFLAHEIEGKPYARKTIKGICLRGDDVTELMSCYLSLFGKPIPNSLRKGINDVLQGFDEYTFAKYKGNRKSVKMRDLLCLCRPAPQNNEQSDLWKRVLEDKLKIPFTWETELSKNGNNAKTWEKLIDSGKVGYMALLRNLRNIIISKPKNADKVFDIIQNPKYVKTSKQLPFRFLSAYKELIDIADSEIFDCLENAIEASIENMPKFDGTTVIAVDISDSMGDTISKKSNIRCYEIAMLLGLIANKICEKSIFYVFNNQIQKYAFSHRTAILETVINSSCFGGTNMYLPFEKIIYEGINADRMIIISDNQCNCGYYNKTVQSLADEYRRKSGNDIWVHAIDLQGYGTRQFCGRKTNVIAGWSEKVFQFIKIAEQEDNIINTIENYQF